MRLAGVSASLTAILHAVVDARPACARLLRIDASTGRECVVIRSPTGEPARQLTLWEDATGLGAAFRAWHVHPSGARFWREGATDRDAFVAVVLAVIDGELVGLVDPAPKRAQLEPLVDLRSPSSLREELTHPFSSGRGTLVSWSGTGDREVSLAEVAV